MTMPDALRLHADADSKISILYDDHAPRRRHDEAIHLKISACLATLAGDARAEAAFCRLVYGASPTRRLAIVEPVLPMLGVRQGNTGSDALLHLARFSSNWVREPEEWQPEPGEVTLADRVTSLARHLFVLYATPAFLDSAWLLGLSDDAEAYRRWFVHLAQGEKLEAIRFPVPMTHRAAHFFLQAPDDFTIPAALRFGQTRALGGGETLARAVAESFLSDLQDDEAFWFSVVTFFVNQRQAIPSWQVGPCLDFLRHRKEQEPNFTMKGRTGEAMLARVADWHETLSRLSMKIEHWTPTTWLQPFEATEPDDLSRATCLWRIVELTDSLALVEEAREMRHCVRTYAKGCAAGKTCLWSLRLNLSDNPILRRLLTIEIDRHRRAIVQVRGKCNQTLGQLTRGSSGNQRMMRARDILREWARRERLLVACAL